MILPDIVQEAARRWANFGFALEYGQAHLGLARCLIALSNLEAATEPLQKARAISPDSARFRSSTRQILTSSRRKRLPRWAFSNHPAEKPLIHVEPYCEALPSCRPA